MLNKTLAKMGSRVSHETYLSHNTDAKDGYRYSATFEDNYFSEGACRLAFKGTLGGMGPRHGQRCVAKVSKKEYARRFALMAPDLAASKKASGFAKEFANTHMCKIRNFIRDNDFWKMYPPLDRMQLMMYHPSTVTEIEFLIPLIAKMNEVSSFNFLWLFPVSKDERFVKAYEYVAIEPFIDGRYEKFNSNGGYENRLNEVMTAFCHWTWSISGHKYMVCDLQGVKSAQKYILTDPAIHSFDRQFGGTDLGTVGMEMVLSNHSCNRLCLELGLYNPLQGVKTGMPGKKSTTYSFQVTEENLMRANRGKSDYFTVMSAIYE